MNSDILPVVTAAEFAYELSRRLLSSPAGVLVRNEADRSSLWLGTDVCLCMNRVYKPDDRVEFFFFIREFATALDDWCAHSKHQYDLRVHVQDVSRGVFNLQVNCVRTGGVAATASTSVHGPLTEPFVLADATTVLGLGKIAVDMSACAHSDGGGDTAAIVDLHARLVPVAAHWLLFCRPRDALPLMLSLYTPAPAASEALLMRLCIQQREVTEARYKRRKLSAAGLCDTFYIAIAACGPLACALRQRLAAVAVL